LVQVQVLVMAAVSVLSLILALASVGELVQLKVFVKAQNLQLLEELLKVQYLESAMVRALESQKAQELVQRQAAEWDLQ
jgi:hypothetical protein